MTSPSSRPRPPRRQPPSAGTASRSSSTPAAGWSRRSPIPRSSISRADSRPASHVEADVQRVAVLHYVVAALDAHPAAPLGLDLRPGLEQPVPLDDLRADEPARQVGVDAPGGGLGVLAPPDRPRPRLLGPGREEWDQ